MVKLLDKNYTTYLHVVVIYVLSINSFYFKTVAVHACREVGHLLHDIHNYGGIRILAYMIVQCIHEARI